MNAAPRKGQARMLKISLEPTDRERLLREVYGDPDEEWERIMREASETGCQYPDRKGHGGSDDDD